MEAKAIKGSVLAGCAIVASGCAPLLMMSHRTVSGSGVPATERRTLKASFDSIQERGVANVYVKVGPATSVKVEGDDNIVPLVRTLVEDNTLVITTKKSVRPRRKLLITVTAPSLKDVQMDGAGNITVRGLDAEDFKVSMDGTGNITCEGSARNLSASIDGSGNLRLDNLKAQDAEVSLDGAGNLRVWATDSLSASLDGVGNIRYKGDPHVNKSIDGVGRIESM